MLSKMLRVALVLGIVLAPFPARADGVGKIEGQIQADFGGPVQSGTPTTNQVLVFDGTKWKAAGVPSGAPSGPAGGDLSGTYPNPGLAAGLNTVLNNGSTRVDGTSLSLGGSTVASDVAPGSALLLAQNAYPQASVNQTGADTILGATVGSHYWTIVSAAGCSGKTFSVWANAPGDQLGPATVVLTDGIDFTHSAVNNTEATNLAGAVNANGTLSPLISATSVGAVVYLTPKSGLYKLSNRTNAGGGNATAFPGSFYSSTNAGRIGITSNRTFLFENQPGLVGVVGADTVASGYETPGVLVYAEPAAVAAGNHNLAVALNFNTSNEWEVTGQGAALHVGTSDASALKLWTNLVDRWQVGPTTGDLTPITDNAVQAGDSTHAIKEVFSRKLSINGSTSGTTSFVAGATPTSVTYTLPSNKGSAGQVLTDAAGNGTLSWTTISAGASINPTTTIITLGAGLGAVADIVGPSDQAFLIEAASGKALSLMANGAATTGWTITSAGHFTATDNTYDIGASGATRPRNFFLAGNATISGTGTQVIGTGSSVLRMGTELDFASGSGPYITVSNPTINLNQNNGNGADVNARSYNCPAGGGVLSQFVGPSDQEARFSSGSGKAIRMLPGAAAGGVGGDFIVQGIAATSNGSNITMSCGNSSAGGTPGFATLTAGSGTSGNTPGSTVNLNGGASTGTDTNSASNDTWYCATATGAGIDSGFEVKTGFPLASGTTAHTLYDRLYISGQTKVLSNTSGTTTTFAQLNLATTGTGGGCTVTYTVIADDGTNVNVAHGSFDVAASNKSGTVTASASSVIGEATNTTSGTLSDAAAVTVTGTAVNLRITPTFAVIVPTMVRIQYSVVCNGRVTVTPQ